MKYTDDIPEDVLKAMHLLIATKDGVTVENSKFYVDDENEMLVFENIPSRRTYKANISGDSVRATVIDFCRQIVLR